MDKIMDKEEKFDFYVYKCLKCGHFISAQEIRMLKDYECPRCGTSLNNFVLIPPTLE